MLNARMHTLGNSRTNWFSEVFYIGSLGIIVFLSNLLFTKCVKGHHRLIRYLLIALYGLRARLGPSLLYCKSFMCETRPIINWFSLHSCKFNYVTRWINKVWLNLLGQGSDMLMLEFENVCCNSKLYLYNPPLLHAYGCDLWTQHMHPS